MMSMEYRELLLEIGCEEMPASWIPDIEAQLAERLGARLEEARIERRTPVRAFSAPRRLVATVAELAERQSDLEETVTGPPVRAAFDADGAPTRAALGFARKQGVDVGDLARVRTPKGERLACRRRQAGDATRSVLAASSPPRCATWRFRRRCAGTPPSTTAAASSSSAGRSAGSSSCTPPAWRRSR